MNKLLITIVLVIAFSLSALAAGGKFKTKQRYVTPAPEQQLKSYKARRKSDREKVDYQSVECGEVETDGTQGSRDAFELGQSYQRISWRMQCLPSSSRSD